VSTFHYKKWKLADLGTDKAKYTNRIKLIHSLNGQFSCIREHQFTFDEEFLMLNSEFIKPCTTSNFNKTLSALEIFASELETINSLSLPHGDIVDRNIIWDGDRFVLVDWEPLLEYGIAPNVFFKSTKPYISKLDLENFSISSNTDKIAFYYFSRKKLFGWFITNPLEVLHLENYLVQQDFIKLLEIASKNMNLSALL